MSERIAPAYQDDVGKAPQYGPTLPYAYESDKLKAMRPGTPHTGATAVDTSDLHGDTILSLHQFAETVNSRSHLGSTIDFGQRLAAGESPRSAIKSHTTLMNQARQQAIMRRRFGYDGDDF